LITSVLFALSIALGFAIQRGLQDRQLSQESRNWPSTKGRIIDSRVEDASRARSCRPVIHYRYELNGVTFTGERVGFQGYGCAEAREFVATRAPGSGVTVWYRPGDPSTSILQPDTWARRAKSGNA
jgi:hypothetical protein